MTQLEYTASTEQPREFRLRRWLAAGALTTLCALGVGVGGFELHKYYNRPSTINRYTNDVLKTIHSGGSTFRDGSKVLHIKQYNGTLSVTGDILRRSPTNDTGIDADGQPYDNNLDIVHTYGDHPNAFVDPIIVEDALTAEASYWAGAPDSDGTYMWVQLSKTQQSTLKPADLPDFSGYNPVSAKY